MKSLDINIKNWFWGFQLPASLFISLILWPRLFGIFNLEEIGQLAIYFQSGSLLAPIFGGVFGLVLLSKNHEYAQKGIFSNLALSLGFTFATAGFVLNGFSLLISTGGSILISVASFCFIQASSLIMLIKFRVLGNVFQFVLQTAFIQAIVPYFIFVIMGSRLSLHDLLLLFNAVLSLFLMLSSKKCSFRSLTTNFPTLLTKSFSFLPNHLLGLVLLLGGKFYLGIFHGLVEVGWFQIPSLYGGGFMIAAILLTPLTHRLVVTQDVNSLDKLFVIPTRAKNITYFAIWTMPIVTIALIAYVNQLGSRVSELMVTGLILALTSPLVWLNEFLNSVYLKGNQNPIRLFYVGIPAVVIAIVASLIDLGSPLINISLAIYFGYSIRAILHIYLNIPKSSHRRGLLRFIYLILANSAASGLVFTTCVFLYFR